MEREKFGEGEAGNGEGFNLESARQMIESTFPPEEGKWVEELLESYKRNPSHPEEFLRMVQHDPRCEVLRHLAFDVKEGDVVKEDEVYRDLRPSGKVTELGGKKYVGGWEVDELGFYKDPGNQSPEVFNRLKANWVSTYLLGARMAGENEKEHMERLNNLRQKIEEFYRMKAENEK